MDKNNKPEIVRFFLDNKEYVFNVRRDTYGQMRAIDVSNVSDNGLTFYGGPGRRSIADCESAITYICGKDGTLLYRGFPIEVITENLNYLETAYLLLYGDLPTDTQYADFEKEIITRMHVHERMKNLIKEVPYDPTHMELIQIMVTALGGYYRPKISAFSGTGPEVETARNDIVLNLIAKIPTIVAMAFRLQQGKEYIPRRTDLDYMQNFLNMCFAESPNEPYPAIEIPEIIEAMEIIGILHADHEQNASTACVRQAGSTGTIPYSAFAAGIATLAGGRHGGANRIVIENLEKIKSTEDIDDCIKRAADRNDPYLLHGMGHPVYDTYDPRVDFLRQINIKLQNTFHITNPLFVYAQLLEQRAREHPFFIENNLYPNVDFYSGLSLTALGFSKEMLTPIFALYRTIGWAANWLEMVSGKQVPVARARQRYVGFTPEERAEAIKQLIIRTESCQNRRQLALRSRRFPRTAIGLALQ